jgi:DNA repair protein RadD
LRLHPDKQHALILDYADNNSAHFPDGNVFNPKIKAKKPGESERIDVDCPDCRFTNSFALRPNDAGFVVNNEGNWTWPDSGTEVLNDEKQPIPGHLGRRCFGILRNNTRCTYRFAFKECPDCNHENDIAARYCEKCKHELVDPNAKLSIESGKQGSFLIEPVMTIELGERIAKTGTKLKEVTITTALRKKIKLFLRMAIESDREKFRLCRDFADKECSVEFKPDGKYYSFVNLSAGMPWQ